MTNSEPLGMEIQESGMGYMASWQWSRDWGQEDRRSNCIQQGKKKLWVGGYLGFLSATHWVDNGVSPKYRSKDTHLTLFPTPSTHTHQIQYGWYILMGKWRYLLLRLLLQFLATNA